MSIEMIELAESRARLLPRGHLLIDPVTVTRATNTSVFVDLILGSSSIEDHRRKGLDGGREISRGDERSEITVAIFPAEDEAGRRKLSRRSVGSPVRNVHKQTLIVPRFALFVPESLIKASAQVEHDGPHRRGRPMLRKTFVLHERANNLQIFDWIRANFLCFQFGQIVDHENQLLEASDSEQFLWANDARRLDVQTMLSVCRFSANSSGLPRGSTDDEIQKLVEEGFELNLIDSRTLHEPARTRRIGLMFEPKERQLTLESDDSDLLVALVQLLAIERLKLNCRDHAVGSNGVETLLEQLDSINDNSRQLEESERRIQTEIYESAELIKSLMQQMSISNELQMFAVSKELLAEVSMLLDETQNSAQAFYLNNRSRLGLMKQANCLRGKVLFLTGEDEDAASRVCSRADSLSSS